MGLLLKRHLPILAAIAVLILGGAVAAMAAGAGNTSASGSNHHAGTHAPRGRRLLGTAATYIGIPLQTLEADLRSGKSLAQIATEAGKTEAGLVTALTASASSGLHERLSELVKQPGGVRGLHRRGRALRLGAASYLGITPAALRADLHANRTLAEVADATPGHSSSGLISSLVAAREAQLPAHGTSLKPGPRSNSTRSSRLRQRITSFVEHRHASTVKHTPAARG